ncbi:probable tRNA N6-adenosine threonylcarbamoyltransferase, mitochondrial isoform X2 [Telopea speciosissima]|uniref:probable tRNA N6-adenosine threonylcarbamoyltransferase, mitochondrial isoform X2 n=1 Tax=Telopea speciosissima TaxID=54955 RepID=UPI001CC7DB54|nr:probable tRNA N6-adenosine threonylcarbamoyltransferase, mitochondrial isoform X2 [Telopea speciosissima]
MVAFVLNVSPKISRFNLFRKRSLPHTVLPSLTHLRPQHRIQQPTRSHVFSSLGSPAARFSISSLNSSKTQNGTSGTGEDLVVLGIETSCDDTAAAVVRGNGEILSQVVSSQADLLARYGGVAPKMAEEAHSQVIDQVVQQALEKANLAEMDLSAVAVTIGPGLSLCLRVGVQKARKIAGKFNLPIVGVHHMEAHALVARLMEEELRFPFLALLISGGHNLLILAHDVGQYVQLGTTIDDAIGEAYDKTARWLGLDMRRSGGPALEELAQEGDAHTVKFKVPMKQHKDCNFSYAGLKTQVRLAIESRNVNNGIPISSASCTDRSTRADIAASFQRVAVLHLEERCDRAIEWALNLEPSVKFLVVSGGVASNKYVRTRLDEVVKKKGLQLVCPPPNLCTDNGVMVAWTGIEHFRLGRFDPPPPPDEPEDSVFDLRPRWPLGEEYSEGRSEARSLRRARMHPSLTSIIQASMQQ